MISSLTARLKKSESFSTATLPIMAVLFLTIAGGLLRWYHLDFKSLWLDEAMLYWISQGSLGDILKNNAQISLAPPLYPFVLAVVGHISASETGLRLLSWLAGTAAIPAMFILAKRWLAPWSAVICSLLLAVASTQVMYAQQVREYSIVVLLTIGMLIAFQRFFDRPGWISIAIYSLVAALALWTQYGPALLVASLNIVFVILLVMLRSTDWKTRTLFWAVGQIPLVVSVTLIYSIALRHQMDSGGSGIQYLASGYWDPSIPIWKFAYTNTRQILDFTFQANLFFPFILAAGFIVGVVRKELWTPLLLSLIPFAVALLFGIARLYPYIGSRHNIYLTPIVFLIAGVGIDYLWRIDPRKIVAGLFVIIFALYGVKASWNYLQDTGQENMRLVVDTLNDQLQKDDRVYVYYAAYYGFNYYYDDQQDVRIINGVFSRSQPEQYVKQMAEIPSGNGRLWLVLSHCYSSECEDILNYYQSPAYRVSSVVDGSGAYLYLVTAQ